MPASSKNLFKQVQTGDIWGGLAASAVVLPQAMAFGVTLLVPFGIDSAAPLLIVYALGKRPTQATAIMMMITGILIVIIWRQMGWHTYIYEGMPGIMGGLLVFTG